MSTLIELDLDPDERTLRQFGFIATLAFGLLALSAQREILVFSGGLGALRFPLAGLFALLAGFSLLASIVRPRANRALFVGSSLLAYPIGLVLSSLIMGTLFYALITPVGVLFRVIGRDPLKRGFEPKRESYWEKPEAVESDERYFRQF